MKESDDTLGKWHCPACGWTIVAYQTPEEAQRLADEGWWWCENGHVREKLVSGDGGRPIEDPWSA